ncbi:hypothetical protein BDU57DRAFT_511281 [Ampelomyces quisqualis]|uniref:Uncharacterized protein n=1 Tax=Ampelomyces quisqualis TaxID=50730 RepID=A0A6A5R224_AMPQU|nr:hypothetical protein BDU57DRAFT_511281 [Ampelomyces quisqualis]
MENAEEYVTANLSSLKGGGGAATGGAPVGAPPPPHRRQLDKVSNGFQAISSAAGVDNSIKRSMPL